MYHQLIAVTSSFWNTEYFGFKCEERKSWENTVEEVEDVTEDYQCKA